MPNFYYKAVSREGETVTDYSDAQDESALIYKLQQQGYIPIHISPAKSKPFAWLGLTKSAKDQLSRNEIAMFTRELATLFEAGLPLDRSLTILMDLSDEDSKLHRLVEDILERVKGGSHLSDALEAQGTVFSRFYLNIIRAGEAGGSLAEVFERLSVYLERSKQLRDTITTALIYPAILVVMAAASLFVLLTFVVPQFTEMFDMAGGELPLSTRIVITIADWLQSYWWVLIGLIVVAVSYMRYQLADSERRYVWDSRFLKLPLVGDLITKVEVARFSQTLGTLLANGVPLLSALSIVKETLTNRVIADKVQIAAASLKEGKELSGPLIESELFPKMAIQMIKLGEETGRLEEMLDKVAVVYDQEVKVSIQRLLSLIEPVLIVGLGILIAGIIVSVLMAILSVNDLAF